MLDGNYTNRLLLSFSLFSKLALLLRQRITAFGHDVQISVRCLQTLVQAIDARYNIDLMS